MQQFTRMTLIVLLVVVTLVFAAMTAYAQAGNTIEVTVWVDRNQNTIFDAGDQYINEGLEVRISQPDGTVLAQVTTGENGVYTASNLPGGDIQVRVLSFIVADSLFMPITPVNGPNNDFSPFNSRTVSTDNITLGTGETVSLNAPVTVPGEVDGRVFIDADLDEELDEPEGANLIDGVTIQLWTSDPATGNRLGLVDEEITANRGFYEFASVLPGEYALVVVDPPQPLVIVERGFWNTDNSSNSFTIGLGETGVNVPLAPEPAEDPGTIEVAVFADRNLDGVFNDGDQRITDNIAVSAFGFTPATEVDFVDTAVNDVYTFTDLPADRYRITVTSFFTDGSEFTLIAPVAGSQFPSANNPRVVQGEFDLASGETLLLEAPIAFPGGVSGTVFEDSNENGALDDGESGIGGVTVRLFGVDSAGRGTGQIDEVVTAGNGNYGFPRLVPGDYRLEIVPPRPLVEVGGFWLPNNFSNIFSVGNDVVTDRDAPVEPAGPPDTIIPGSLQIGNSNISVTATERPQLVLAFGNRTQQTQTNVRLTCAVTEGDVSFVTNQVFAPGGFTSQTVAPTMFDFSGLNQLPVGQNFNVNVTLEVTSGTSTITCDLFADGVLIGRDDVTVTVR